MPISFVSEALAISGVALDLVGAAVLSHAHNAESALELREEAGGDERALGEKDAIATHAPLYVTKSVTFGANPFADYTSLVLWGLGSDVAGRSLANLGAEGKRQPAA